MSSEHAAATVAELEAAAATAGAEIVAEQTEDAVDAVVTEAVLTETLSEGAVALANETAAAAELQAATTFAQQMERLSEWQLESRQSAELMQAQLAALDSNQRELTAGMLAISEAMQSILSRSNKQQEDREVETLSPDSTKTDLSEKSEGEKPEPRKPRRVVL